MYVTYVLIASLLLTTQCLAAHYPSDMSKLPADATVFPSNLENMRPGQIRDAAAQGAVALLPVGTLESSEDDSPLGASEEAVNEALAKVTADRKTVIAPPIWYAPTGYLNGRASDGTFDMPTMAFISYVRDVFNDLRAMGFKRVEIVVLDKGAAEQSLAYAACAYILGDYMNKYWDRPDTGKGWWANPETKVMSWETSGIRLARLRAEPPAVKTADLALPLRLERMRPSELREAVRRGIPCFVPAGVIENHGSHNPVGVDAIEVQDPLVDAAKLWPVVVAPTIWYGGTSYAVTGPELGTMNISGDAYLSYTLGITEGLVAMGFRHLTYVHVHQAGGAQDTSIALSIQEFRRHLGGQKSPRNIAIVDHMGNPGGNCDHAGKHETSWMMYYRKPYVDLSLIRPNDYMFCWYKGDESNTATYEWGKRMAEESIRNYEKVIKERTIPPMTGRSIHELPRRIQ